jgi:hypothetical protein
MRCSAVVCCYSSLLTDPCPSNLPLDPWPCLLSAVCGLLCAVCCHFLPVCCLLTVSLTATSKAVSCLLSANCCRLAAASCLMFAVYCLLPAICYLFSASFKANSSAMILAASLSLLLLPALTCVDYWSI